MHENKRDKNLWMNISFIVFYCPLSSCCSVATCTNIFTAAVRVGTVILCHVSVTVNILITSFVYLSVIYFFFKNAIILSNIIEIFSLQLNTRTLQIRSTTKWSNIHLSDHLYLLKRFFWPIFRLLWIYVITLYW